MKLTSLSVLIPAYNDAGTIDGVIKEAMSVGRQAAQRLEVIVIDDGSSDSTYARLLNLKKKYKDLVILRHGENQGYGKTIKELYLKGTCDWLFSIPGDYQVGAKELLSLLPKTQQTDCIIGWRSNRHDPPPRLIQSAFYNGLIRVLFGLPLHDINSVRLMRRRIIQSVGLRSESAFVDAELTIKAHAMGFAVIEIPISHRERMGSVGGGGKWWTIVPTIVEMFRFRMLLQFRGN